MFHKGIVTIEPTNETGMQSTAKKLRQGDATDADGEETASFGSIDELTASEYLARVSQQAKSMPNVFVDASLSESDGASTSPSASKRKRHKTLIPIDGSAASLSYLLSGRASLTPPPSQRHLPENINEWTTIVISNFEQLRGYLEDCRSKGVGGKESNRRPLPPMKDRVSWFTFCVGIGDATNNNLAQGNSHHDTGGTPGMHNGVIVVNATRQNAQNKGPTSTRDTPPAWRANLPDDGYSPTVQLLCQMDQVMIRRVLSHLTHFVHCGWLIGSRKLSEWIYALLARLEKPIHRDDAAVMFSLLKDLCLARSKIDCNDDAAAERGDSELRKLNTLITLIGVYFEQGGGVNGVVTCR